jgi:hypothetical protein
MKRAVAFCGSNLGERQALVTYLIGRGYSVESIASELIVDPDRRVQILDKGRIADDIFFEAEMRDVTENPCFRHFLDIVNGLGRSAYVVGSVPRAAAPPEVRREADLDGEYGQLALPPPLPKRRVSRKLVR